MHLFARLSIPDASPSSGAPSVPCASSAPRASRAPRAGSILAAALLAGTVTLVPSFPGFTAEANAGMTCRKVTAKMVTGEGRNAGEGSRVRCDDDEFLTGGTCYPDVRPEEDGSCQTSAMGIIQTVMGSKGTTSGAFFTCLQTGGTDCPVEERTRAMAVCCKFEEDASPEEDSSLAEDNDAGSGDQASPDDE